MVFNHGSFESPLICSADSEPQSIDSTQLESLSHTYDVDGRKRIASVRVSVDKFVEITRVEMSYEGDEVAFNHTFDARGKVYTQQIPEG